MSETEVLKAVQKKFAGNPKYNTKEMRIAQSNSFLWGAMQTVTFPRTDGSPKTVWAWEPENKVGDEGQEQPIRIMEDVDDVVSFVSLSGSDIRNRVDKRARSTFLAKFGPVEAISGVIALMLTLTIVFIVLYQLLKVGSIIDPPGIFANALTIILGFYFGRASTNTTSSP